MTSKFCVLTSMRYSVSPLLLVSLPEITALPPVFLVSSQEVARVMTSSAERTVMREERRFFMLVLRGLF
jgi:hypothetical protein